MEGNKLKHNFVEKDKSPISDIMSRWQNYLNQANPFLVETSAREWETISVSEIVSYELLRLERGGDYQDMIEREMVRKLVDIMLENNFIDILEEDRPYSNDKVITMRVNIQKR